MEVFLYDLRRMTRRGRLALVRSVYAAGLLIAVGSVYARWFPGRLTVSGLFTSGPELPPREMAQFAQNFTETCLLVQLAAVIVLTPAYAAGAVAEEWQRRTLDDLLVTDLSSAAIVLGKLAARWLHVVAVLFTGLPVLGLAQWWGGVDLSLLLGGFMITALAALNLAALSLFCSVLAQTVLGAVTAAYLGTALLYFCPCCFCANPFVATFELIGHGTPNFGEPDFNEFRGVLLAFYVLSHLVLVVVLSSTAVFRLRGGDSGPGFAARRPEPEAVAIRPLSPVGDPFALDRTFPLPPVGDRPLLWKEQQFGGRTATWEMFRVVEIALTGYALVVGTTLVLSFWIENERQGLGNVLGFQTVIPLTLFIVGVAIRAAGSVSRERERRTLDSLLTLPGGRAEVLRAKWLGSVDWCRWPTLGLPAMWMLGTLVGGISPVGLALLLLAFAAHVGFVASAGLYLSVAARGTGAATFGMVLVLLAACGLPWLAWSLWDGLATSAQHQAVPWLGRLLWDGLLPPATWWALTGRSESITGGPDYAVIAAGLALYAGAAGLFWWRAVVRFQRGG